MGYVIRAKDNMQKNEIFNFLHSRGLASKPSPFPSRAEICRYVVIFEDHFYTAHGIDLNAVMEEEETLELKNVKELKRLWMEEKK